MKRIILVSAMVLMLSGCLTSPPKQVVTEDGQVVTLTEEQQLARLEAQYQDAKLTIAKLQESAGWLPPGVDVAALSALAGLSAYLERRRRQLAGEIKKKTEAA